jgi:hypothetical protein
MGDVMDGITLYRDRFTVCKDGDITHTKEEARCVWNGTPPPE